MSLQRRRAPPLAPDSGIDVIGAGVTVHASGPEPAPRRVLNGLSDIRAFFHTNTVPLYFISPTPNTPGAGHTDRLAARRTSVTLPAGITIDNWLSEPYSQWSFQHVEDFVPTAVISRGTGPLRNCPQLALRSLGSR